MILEECCTPFLNLSDEDALSLILKLRESRRISKKPIIVKAEKLSPRTNTLDLNKEISKLSSDSANALLLELLNRRKK